VPAQQSFNASFLDRHRNGLLGGFAVVLFFAAWQAIFLLVPLNPLFMTSRALSRQVLSTSSKAAI
jgi:hypothetical protein